MLVSSFKPRITMLFIDTQNWTSDVDDRQSTGSYCNYYGSNLVLWSSKKQYTISRSSTESEYQAIGNGTAEIVWIQALLQELDIMLTKLHVLWCDNISANSLAANPTFHACTKHIEIDVHFVRDHVVSRRFAI